MAYAEHEVVYTSQNNIDNPDLQTALQGGGREVFAPTSNLKTPRNEKLVVQWRSLPPDNSRVHRGFPEGPDAQRVHGISQSGGSTSPPLYLSCH